MEASIGTWRVEKAHPMSNCPRSSSSSIWQAPLMGLSPKGDALTITGSRRACHTNAVKSGNSDSMQYVLYILYLYMP